jgi:EAL domain-containing protein (putative c-di-GMP-specific phosphodiesterase class I)
MTVVDHDSAVADVPLWRILDAIGNGEIHPHYQPIVSLRSGDVLGVEALARWARPGHGVVPATAFVPILEQARRVSALTAFMIDRACADLARWQDEGRVAPAFRVAINVSATELADRRLIGLVRGALLTHGVQASSLCLELTETARIDDVDLAAAVLAELAERVGVRLAVDDYGTGFANDVYLRSLPFDVVKIDQSFVAGMADRADYEAFVKATIDYAEDRRLGVVAEGVENRGQAEALLSAGCTVGQGFGLAMPCPAEEIVDRRFVAASEDHPAG